MSKKWSSYEKDQLLTESWRSFLETETSPNEKAEELDEGFLDKLKKLKGAFGGKQKRPVEYPASEFTQLNVALQSANKMLGSPVVNDDLTTELGDYIKSQNFVISEAEEILLGQDLPFDLTKMPTLKKLMDAAKAKPEVLQALKKQFARAGFTPKDATSPDSERWREVPDRGDFVPGKPPAAPTAPAEPEPEPPEPEAKKRTRKIYIKMRTIGDSKSSSVEKIVLDALGMEKYPDPNKAKDKDKARAQARKAYMLTKKITKAIKSVIEDEIGDVSVGTITESKTLNHWKTTAGIK